MGNQSDVHCTFKWLLAAASCKGLIPSGFSQLTLAPAFNNSTIISLDPSLDASWSGVQPKKGKEKKKQKLLPINQHSCNNFIINFICPNTMDIYVDSNVYIKYQTRNNIENHGLEMFQFWKPIS